VDLLPKIPFKGDSVLVEGDLDPATFIPGKFSHSLKLSKYK